MFKLYRFNQRGGVELIGEYVNEGQCCLALSDRQHPLATFFAEKGDRYIQFRAQMHTDSLAFFIYATPVRLESILELLERKY